MAEISGFSPQHSTSSSRKPSLHTSIPTVRLSTLGSRTDSLQHDGGDDLNDIKGEVMVNWLHSKQERKLWTMGEEGEGVMLKKSRGIYTCAPIHLAEEETGFFQAVQMLNVKVRWPTR